jgi:hypothetical protein
LLGSVVLIDDSTGTGNQAFRYWSGVLEEQLFGQPRVVLLLAAAQAAFGKITSETKMELICTRILTPSENLFSQLCTSFDADEKTVMLNYCRIADPVNPTADGECGLVVVLAHQCPFRSEEDANYKGASYGWQNFTGSLERVVGELD